jgi:hypothetical protein
MKTFATFLLAFLFLFSAPAMAARKNPGPAPEKKSHATASRFARHHAGKIHSGKSEKRTRKKNKGFEAPKKRLSKLRKNPNHTKSHFFDGGFYSFRKQAFILHLFHRKS